MNGPFQVAQAGGTATSSTNGTPARIYKLTKPLTDQAVTVNLGYDQKVKIDFSAIANEKITLVHIGEKLIILFDNESTVTVEPFFKSRADGPGNDTRDEITVEMAPGRDISVKEFATLFPITTDASVLPAAGGNSNGNAQASGAYFSPFSVDPLDPVLLNRLAPQEELGNFVLEIPTGGNVIPDQGELRPGELPPAAVNGFPTIGVNALSFVDDDDLAQGNIGGIGDRDPQNVIGVLAHDFGSDGTGTVLLSGAVLPAGFTSGLNADGTQLTIFQNGKPVLLLTLADTVSGAYAVTQLAPVIHPLGENENDVSFTINYIVKDGNGDSVAGQFVVDVNDDTPETPIVLAVGTARVDETVGDSDDGVDPFSFGTPLGVATTQLVTVTNSKFGADFEGGKTIVEIAFPTGTGQGADSGLRTTDGTSVFLFLNHGIIEGRVGGEQGAVAFALSIDNGGVLTVAQYLSLHHQDPNNPDDSLELSGIIAAKVTVTEADGDVAETLVVIAGAVFFEDDGPTLTVSAAGGEALFGFALNVDETVGADRANPPEIADGNTDDAGPGLAQVTTNVAGGLAGGLFTIGGNAGSDGEASLTGTLSFVFTGPGPLATTLTATDGGAIVLELSADGQTITGRDTFDNSSVFTIAIVGAPGSQQLQLTQFEAIDHDAAPGGNENPDLFDEVARLLLAGQGGVQLQYEVTRTDNDGDAITVADQIDLITSGTTFFTFDDDGPTLTVDGSNQPTSGSLALNVDETVGADRANLPEIADGNTDDAGPGLAQVTTNVAGGLAGGLFTIGGNAGSDGEASLTGTLSFVFTGPGPLATTLTATDGGAIVLELSADGQTITGRDTFDNSSVFTIAIVGAPGSQQLQLTQFEAIDHDAAPGGNENPDLFDEVARLLLAGQGGVQLQYEVTRTDNDGDAITVADQIDLITSGTTFFTFDDDGPTLTVDGSNQPTSGSLALNVDETVGADRANPPEIADGNTDDAGPGLAQVTTNVAGGLAGGLFTIGGNAGSDGEASLTGTLSFVFTGQGPLATTLTATDGGAIVLELSADGQTITGRDTFDNSSVFTIAIVGAPGSQQLQLTQFEAIDHDAAPGGNENPDLFDEVARLLLAGQGGVQLQYEVTRTDNDGDAITVADQIDLITSGTTFFTFDDDGPTFVVTAQSQNVVVHDETGGIQNGGAGDLDGNDVPFAALPAAIQTQFSGIAPVVDDPHVSNDTGGAIGYAQSTGSMLGGFVANYGSDGFGSQAYSLILNGGDGTASGLFTTEGGAISLFQVSSTLIVGRYDGADGGTGVSLTDPAAFAIAIDPATGVTYIAQYVSFDHPNEANAGNGFNSYDEFVSIADGKISAAVTVTDGDGDSASSTVDISGNIRFEDDGPIAMCDTATVKEGGGQAQDINVCFVLDFSGSISNTDFNTMLNAVTDAGQALFANAGSDVSITLVRFANGANTIGTFTDFAAFETALNINAGARGINTGGTDYTAAIEEAMDSFVPNPGAINQVFFFSDGEPNQNEGFGHSLEAPTRADWNDFVGDNDINVQTIGVAGATADALQDVDEVDGNNGVILIGDFDDLVDTLLDAVGTIGGNTVSGNVLNNDGFGADGLGGINSIVVDGVTYTYNVGNGTIVGGVPGADLGGGKLEVETVLGGTLIFFFVDNGSNVRGDYKYQVPTDIPATQTEIFTYTITDGDNDGHSAQLKITVEDNPRPTITNLTPAVDGGDVTVNENDLLASRGNGESAGSDTSQESLTQPGTFTISSPDGIKSLTIDGHTVISNGVFTATSFTTSTLGNTLSVTGYDAATGVVSYSYTLLDNKTHATGAGTNELFENLAVVLTDQDDQTANDTLVANIVDDVPTANADSDSVSSISSAVQTLNFDDVVLGDNAETPIGSYQGFNFIQTGVYNPPGSGPFTTYAPHSGSNLAFVGEKNGQQSEGYIGNPGDPITIAHTDGSRFTALGAWFSSNGSDPMTITVSGYVNGILVDSFVQDIHQGGAGGPTYVNLSVLGSVDKITFNGPGYFGFDDFSYVDNLSATGNVITGAGTTNNGVDVQGADGAVVAGVAAGNTGTDLVSAGTVGNVVHGAHGDLTLNADGSYSYARNPGSQGGVDDVFTYTLRDGDGDLSHTTLTIAIGDSTPSDTIPAAGGATTTVYEAALAARGSEPEGSGEAAALGSNGDPREAVSGTIAFSSPDGIQTVSLGGHVLTGSAQSFTDATGTLTASYTYSPGTGAGTISYSYLLLDNTLVDPSSVSFAVVVTDADGDSAPAGNLVISIIDDVPTAVADTDSVAAGIHSPATGNVLVGGNDGIDANTTDGNADTQGADGAVVAGVAAGNTGTDLVSAGTVGNVVHGAHGDLTLNADGSYSYARNPGSQGGVDDVFTYTLRDGDGDLSHTTLTIHIDDSGVTTTVPVAGAAGALVSEAGLPARTGEPEGSDEPSSSETTTGSITYTAADGPAVVTIGGVAVTAVGQSFAGSHGTLKITSITVGSVGYSYTLTDNTSGDATTDTFAVVVTDKDGDHDDKTLTINIVDDVPTAVNDTWAPTITGATPLTGLLGNDLFGADGVDTTNASPGQVTATNGAHGTVTYNNDGMFTYTPTGVYVGDDTFTYTIKDGDGDTSTATVTVHVQTNTTPTGGGTVSLLVNEAALDLFQDGGSPADLHAGWVTGTNAVSRAETDEATTGITFNATGEAITVAFGDPNVSGSGWVAPTVTGLAAGYTIYWAVVSGGELVGRLIQTAGNVDLGAAIYLHLTNTTASAGNSVTPTVTATLTDQLQHALTPAGTNDVTITGIRVVAEDASGDQVSGTVDVTVRDDVPTLGTFDVATIANQVGSVTGLFDISKGADDIAHFNITGPVITGVTYSSATTTNANGITTTTLSAIADPDGPGGNAPVTVYTLALREDGTYTFNLVTPQAATSTTVNIGNLPAGGPNWRETNDGRLEFSSPEGINSNNNAFGVANPFISNGESFTMEFHNPPTTPVTHVDDNPSTNMQLVDAVSLTVTDVKGTVDLHWTATNTATNEIQQGDFSISATGVFLVDPTISFNQITFNASGGQESQNRIQLSQASYSINVLPQDQQLNFAVTATDGDGDETSSSSLGVHVAAASSSNTFTLTGSDSVHDAIGASSAVDTINGKTGSDLADYSDSAIAISINLDNSGNASTAPATFSTPADGRIGGGDATGDSLAGIEGLRGGSGNDFLFGNSSVNQLYGNGGDDTLKGEGEIDILVGGAGADHFRYDQTSEGLDHIIDFNGHGGELDLLEFSSSAFGGLSAGTLDPSHFASNATGTPTAETAQFVFNETTHTLSYDSDGTGAAAAAIAMAVLENGFAINNTDIRIV